MVELDLAEHFQNKAVQSTYFTVMDETVSSETLGDGLHTQFDCFLRTSGNNLIGTALVVNLHNQIADQYTVSDLKQHLRGQLESGIVFQTGEVQ